MNGKIVTTALILLLLAAVTQAQDDLPNTIRAVLNAVEVSPDEGTLVGQIDRVALDFSEETFGERPLEGNYGDFVIGLKLNWSQTNTDVACAVGFRGDGAGNIYIISVDPRFGIVFWPLPNGETIEVNTTLVDPATDPIDEVVLVARGSTFTLYVEGRQVAKFEDDLYARGGLTLIGVTGEPRAGEACIYTDVWVYDLDAPSSVSIDPTPQPESTPGVTNETISLLDAAVLDTLTSLEIVLEDGELLISRPVVLPNDSGVREETLAANVGDFVLNTTLDWRSAADNQVCSLMFRVNDENAYGLIFRAEGDAVFLEGDANGAVDAQQWVNVQNVLNRPGDPINVVTVVGEGSAFRLYIDRELAGEYHDETNSIGDIMLVASGGDQTCTFDETWLWGSGEAAVELPSPVIPATLVKSMDDAQVDSTLPVAAVLSDIQLSLSEESFYVPFGREHVDFAAAVEFTWGAGEGITCGIAFRSTAERGTYYLGMNQRRDVWMSASQGEQWETVDSGNADLVFIGEGGTNTLLLVARGDSFDVYVNGAFIDTFQDAQLTRGEVALMAGGSGEVVSDQTTCAIKQAWLWDLE